jgi:hypothetical protein
MALTPHRLRCLWSFARSKQLSFEGLGNYRHTRSHYARLILKHGAYIWQDKHQFYYMVCKCTNNIGAANEWLTMIGKSPTPRSGLQNTRGTSESVLYWNSHNSVELLHSTELELRKLRRTRMDSGRASTLELFGGLPISREVLRPSEPHLSLYKEWTWEHHRKLNLNF